MGIPGDWINPIDAILMGLSGHGITSEELPKRMLCPAGHAVERDLYRKNDLLIPFYACEPCTVVYRYQECKLRPGDEGTPD